MENKPQQPSKSWKYWVGIVLILIGFAGAVQGAGAGGAILFCGVGAYLVYKG